MEKFFNSTTYRKQVDQLLERSDTIRIVDSSFNCRQSAQNKLSSRDNIYYISEGHNEFQNHNATISGEWREYDDSFIPPYMDGLIIRFQDSNPYNLKWLWRTDGITFVSCGHITTPGTSGKYQSSPYTESEIKNNQYVIDYTSLRDSTLRDEILYVSYWINADIGGVACTNTREYKICLRGPAEKNADFKEWLVSITNPQSVVLAEDSRLIISIAVSGGMVKPFYVKWNKLINKIQKIFRFDSTNF